MGALPEAMRDWPATLEQLPRDAASYYAESTRGGGLFEYEDVGRDAYGRRVYQRLLDGAEYGQPEALLTFAEFTARVKDAATRCGSIGVRRWTAAS